MPSGRALAGVFLLVAGLFIGLVAVEIIAVDEELVHAPRWILGLGAALFAGGGLSLLAGPAYRLAQWSAGTVVVSMTVLSAWVALFGQSEHFSGDWPWLSEETNVPIARILFGAVSLLGLGIIVAAVKNAGKQRDR